MFVSWSVLNGDGFRCDKQYSTVVIDVLIGNTIGLLFAVQRPTTTMPPHAVG